MMKKTHIFMNMNKKVQKEIRPQSYEYIMVPI